MSAWTTSETSLPAGGRSWSGACTRDPARARIRDSLAARGFPATVSNDGGRPAGVPVRVRATGRGGGGGGVRVCVKSSI